MCWGLIKEESVWEEVREEGREDEREGMAKSAREVKDRDASKNT